MLLGLSAGAAYFFVFSAGSHKQPDALTAPAGRSESGKDKRGPQVIPVSAVKISKGDLPVYLNGLGTVTAFNTVVVKSRVGGQLIKVHFKEGQQVHEGDLLAEIDPRPFQVQLAQAEGQMARDQAQLKYAQSLHDRDRSLLEQDYIPRQQLESDLATVSQSQGNIKTDQGLVDNAKLQLSYSRITSPINGRIGMRQVDAGNMVNANDANGLAVITQLQPISVFFNLPQDVLPQVMDVMRGGAKLPVEAYDRDRKNKIADGTLLTFDNAIDANTGTLRFKAVFDNQDNRLFPNQFVNIRLLVENQRDVLLAPAAAVQRNTGSTFVYVIGADNKVKVREVELGAGEGDWIVIRQGLNADEQVVTAGVDKLRDGMAVSVTLTGAAKTGGNKAGQ